MTRGGSSSGPSIIGGCVGVGDQWRWKGVLGWKISATQVRASKTSSRYSKEDGKRIVHKLMMAVRKMKVAKSRVLMVLFNLSTRSSFGINSGG